MVACSPTFACFLKATEKFQEEGKQENWTEWGYFVYIVIMKLKKQCSKLC